ncbi:hypothetical protein BU16DRAFT_93203 [Lophium mytilinum]|uniref:Uncharacterized protein n=1 Tax=Lophium mytilinum TaxID=390894 RepID=A0A6A6QL98_9PEZI|nr:hypothetical protein BU16DRAFT_93203 [Lophium mytilinum]
MLIISSRVSIASMLLPGYTQHTLLVENDVLRSSPRLQHLPALQERIVRAALHRDRRIRGWKPHEQEPLEADASETEIPPAGPEDCLGIPHMPQPIRPSSSEAQCPICSKTFNHGLEENRNTGKWWRSHVMEDLEPYVCLFEECPMEYQAFRTIADWINHENVFFLSRKAFECHLTQDHLDNIPKGKIDHIISKGLRPAPDLITVLVAKADLTTHALLDHVSLCPFCYIGLSIFGFPLNVEANGTAISLIPSALHLKVQDHVAAHLESIALLSLKKTRTVPSYP